MTTTLIQNPADPIVVPRGAQWAADGFAAILNTIGRIVRAITTPSEMHVEAAMEERVKQAAYVRRLAERWRATDPRFADELYAAADRHEIGG